MSRNDRDDGRLRAQVRLLGEGSLNALDQVRWQDVCDREQRTERRQQSAQRDAVERLRVEMWNELGNLRNELEQRFEARTEAVGTVIGESFDKVLDKAEQYTRDSQRDLFALVEKRFSELLARIDTIGSQAPREPRKDFRFAGEEKSSRDDKTEPVELPSGFLNKVLN
jgi:hypothetical protein